MKLFSALAALAATTIAGAAAAFPIAAPGSEGFSVYVTTTGNVSATYHGNSAAYSNDLLLMLAGSDLFIFNNHDSAVGATADLGTFTAGTELRFQLRVNTTGESFYTGPGSRNPDGLAHARVQSGWMPGETLVSFEDLYNGPFDFNDLSFSFTNTGGAPSAVPVPAAGLLLIGGMGALAALRRRIR